MTALRKMLIAVTLLGVMSVFVIPTFAQGTAAPATVSISFAPDQINTWINKHHSHRVSDLVASFASNQITISYNLTKAKIVSNLVAVLSPKLSANKLTWTLDSLMVNGAAATKAQLADYGKGITSLVSNYLKASRSRYNLTAANVDASGVNFTLTHK